MFISLTHIVDLARTPFSQHKFPTSLIDARHEVFHIFQHHRDLDHGTVLVHRRTERHGKDPKGYSWPVQKQYGYSGPD